MAGMPDPLRRLERSIRRRLGLRAAGQRVVRSLSGIAQIVVAATTAYLIARFGLGHEVPVVAVTVTIIALGLARDARPRRVLETVIGINIGIIVSALIVAGIGRGIGQLALILAATLIVARAVSPSAPFAIAAAVQSMLVALLPDPENGSVRPQPRWAHRRGHGARRDRAHSPARRRAGARRGARAVLRARPVPRGARRRAAPR
ncbi:MAG: FUSC family protein [Microcella pacifica]